MRDELVKNWPGSSARRTFSPRSATLLVYEYDSTPDTFQPEVVVFPASAEEASAVMRLAKREGLPLVPRGAGTNLSGGTLSRGGWDCHGSSPG